LSKKSYDECDPRPNSFRFWVKGLNPTERIPSELVKTTSDNTSKGTKRGRERSQKKVKLANFHMFGWREGHGGAD